MWQIAPDIRAMVKFQQLNLLADFSYLGMFDLIFCRNLLIYFDQETKIDLLDRLARVIAGDGYLVLGAAETVVGLTDSFKIVPDKRGLYAPNSAPATPQPVAAPARSAAAPGCGQRRAVRAVAAHANKNPGLGPGFFIVRKR